MNTKKEETMNPDLIATCWVSAGDAAPMRGDETSPIPLAERITAIAQTGWAGIGLVHADLVQARDTIGYPELSRLIREAGIGIVFAGRQQRVNQHRTLVETEQPVPVPADRLL